ncbi:hypothetical protein K470DRAFT_278561 [Piedraia hortae CBS 480.64]|uniref:INO80 complex subunit B-like conserved region domain-containing protein n=1 Tax=Piedraia hortae CBS 480.64 TaxID=1314780 RepID=A0A6A7BTF6_9PEZI|nr:hypothetical protein K470DRAFT_278561 [Piedraia hortae CBS 480.64]
MEGSNKRLKANTGAAAPPPSNRGTGRLNITVRQPPSKLRQAISAPDQDASESDVTPQPAVRLSRATRNPKVIVEPDSDEVDDEVLSEESDEEVDDDAGVKAPAKLSSSDDELSSLEDARPAGEDGEEDDDDDDDEESPFSRSVTPADPSKLTRRQRMQHDEESGSGGLLALPNEAQRKKHLTAEEHAMRRAEMARRRKNLSEKRSEEVKMETINKLLKKPAPRRRTRAEIMAEAATPAEYVDHERPDGLFTRYVSNAKGSRLGVPQQWLDNGLLTELIK